MNDHKIELIPPMDYININTVESHKAGRTVVTGVSGENAYIKFMTANNIPFVHSRVDVFKTSLSKISPTGLIMEFGVYKGGTIATIASMVGNRPVYGFDNWEGFPEDYTKRWRKGTGKCPMPVFFNSNIELIKGWFSDTLVPFLNVHNKNIAFIHIDCDLYSATKYIFDSCIKYINAGTIIQFDELFEFIIEDGKHWLVTHELDAWNEFVAEHDIKFEWLATNGASVVVIITGMRK